ncbi:hypothetical protein Tco_0624290 [Tanacetum coccineum]|uniref:Uncharacterized protein n=1 Tax=Tanacetum coccineum TaxID=301880 RepID=A0ABQ4WDI6_9ASTR
MQNRHGDLSGSVTEAPLRPTPLLEYPTLESEKFSEGVTFAFRKLLKIFLREITNACQGTIWRNLIRNKTIKVEKNTLDVRGLLEKIGLIRSETTTRSEKTNRREESFRSEKTIRDRRFTRKQSHDEVYGCLKGGSRNSGGKRLALSMVEEAWLSKKKECDRKTKSVFVEENECFIEEKECFCS